MANQTDMSHVCVTKTNSTWNFSNCATYVDEYNYTKHVELICSLIQSYMFVIMSGFGLIGYVMQAYVQYDLEFRIPTFIYHNVIVALEIPHMIFLISLGLSALIPTSQQSLLSYEFSANISNTFNKILIMWTDFITLFVCLERCIAVLFPVQFDKVNTKQVVWGGILFSMLSGCCFVLDFLKASAISTPNGPTLVVDPNFNTKYVNFITFRNAYQLAKGYAIAILSVMVVFGLMRISRKKKQTQKASDRDMIKKNMQICILSLLSGIPVTFNSMVYVCYNELYSSYISGTAAFSLSYQSAIDNLSKGQVRAGLLVLVNFSMCVAHCLHFYLNISFSPSFRRVFVRKYRKFCGITRVEPVHNRDITYVGNMKD